MDGWIKLHRQITGSELYFSEKFTKSQAWIDLLLLANHAKATIFVHGVEINLMPGELCYSQLSLSKRWGWSDKTVKKYLEFIKSREMIEYRGGKITTIISIVNWKKYQNTTEQDEPIESVLESTFCGNTSEQLSEQTPNNLRTNKNVKKDKKEKNKSRPVCRTGRLNFYSIENLNANQESSLFYKNNYFYVTEIFKNELIDNFNDLDESILKGEFYKMEDWLELNGAKNNYRRFIINWLSKIKLQPLIAPNKSKKFVFSFNPICYPNGERIE